MVLCGKVSFTNLSRYNEIDERTYRPQYARSYNFIKSNSEVIGQGISANARQVIAIDCSFVLKSGKATYGIEQFLEWQWVINLRNSIVSIWTFVGRLQS